MNMHRILHQFLCVGCGRLWPPSHCTKQTDLENVQSEAFFANMVYLHGRNGTGPATDATGPATVAHMQAVWRHHVLRQLQCSP